MSIYTIRGDWKERKARRAGELHIGIHHKMLCKLCWKNNAFVRFFEWVLRCEAGGHLVSLLTRTFLPGKHSHVTVTAKAVGRLHLPFQSTQVHPGLPHALGLVEMQPTSSLWRSIKDLFQLRQLSVMDSEGLCRLEGKM